VQRVEANGTPGGVIDGVRQQVVHIDHHCRYHDQCGITPPLSEEEQGDYQRNSEVQDNVNHG
jgi:hypothetical protein